MKETWELAYEDYKSGMKYKEIAEKYNVTLNTVKSWKTRHWNKISVHTKTEKVCTQKRKRGGQPGNKNATGPPGNKNAEKHGFFSKWLPDETKEIIQEIDTMSQLDIIWNNIQLQFAAIVRAQKLMYVNDQQDMTKEVSLEGETIGYDIQYAWDKHANFMSAQSRAMKTLESLIKQYENMLHTDWEHVSEEQKAKLELLRAQKKKLESEDNTQDDTVQNKMDAISGIANQMKAPEEDDDYVE